MLRIAVVGTGHRAQDHLRTITLLTDLYRLAGVADADAGRRETAARDYDVPGHATVEDLLDATAPDVLLVAVPPHGHLAMTLAAAERGVHVLSEVPIAPTLPMADAMIAAADRNSVVLEIAENVFNRPAERLKRLVVQRGLLGRVTQAHLWYASGSYHGLSAIRNVLDAEPTRVLGVTADVEGPERPDLLGRPQRRHRYELGVIEFAGGARCVYQQPIHRARGNHWEIVGTRGYLSGDELVIEDGGTSSYPIEPVPGAAGDLRVATEPPVVWQNPYPRYPARDADEVARIIALAGMHAAVTEGAPLPYGTANARREQEILLALRESARLGSSWVDLPLTHVTGVELAVHDEHRERYGHDPLQDAAGIAGAYYPRM